MLEVGASSAHAGFSECNPSKVSATPRPVQIVVSNGGRKVENIRLRDAIYSADNKTASKNTVSWIRFGVS